MCKKNVEKAVWENQSVTNVLSSLQHNLTTILFILLSQWSMVLHFSIHFHYIVGCNFWPSISLHRMKILWSPLSFLYFFHLTPAFPLGCLRRNSQWLPLVLFYGELGSVERQ